MLLRTATLVSAAALALCACDGKTAAENHRQAAGQQTAGGLKEGVGGLIGDTSLQKAGKAQSDRGGTNEKIGLAKDAVHNVLH